MNWFRSLLAGLSAGDKIAILALVIALPATIDWLARQFAAPKLEIVPPAYVEFRSDVPVQAERDDGVLLAHADRERAIDAFASGARLLHSVVPVTFRNDGFDGSELSVREERLVLVSMDDPSRKFEFVAVFNTEIVPADSTHWWWGNIKPWLPVVLDGGESRSSEVVFRATECVSSCSWGVFLRTLQAEGSIYRATLEVEALTGETFYSSACIVDFGRAFASNNAEPPDRKRFYRRDVECSKP